MIGDIGVSNALQDRATVAPARACGRASRVLPGRAGVMEHPIGTAC